MHIQEDKKFNIINKLNRNEVGMRQPGNNFRLPLEKCRELDGDGKFNLL